jgi:hypothetical protein
MFFTNYPTPMGNYLFFAVINQQGACTINFYGSNCGRIINKLTHWSC